MKQPITYVGLDVHKETIAVALAEAGKRTDVREYGKIANTPAAVRALVARLARGGCELRFCYEAGPCGYGIQRQLTAAGHGCVVVAPSLIPRKPGDRIKTDRRDAINLAKLHRAGELTPVWVPDQAHEAIRDLVRARLAAVRTLRQARQQLSGFLLRHGHHYNRPAWTLMHRRWLAGLRFEHAVHHIVLEDCIAAVEAATARRDRLEAHIEAALPDWSLAPVVRALQALRGVRLGDTKHKLIVEQQVTNQVVDMGLLMQTAAPAKSILGVERIDVVADRGYFKIEDLEACENAGVVPYVARPQRGPSVRAGLFRKDEFRYDPSSDSYVCPAGQRLYPSATTLVRGLKRINYQNARACRDCPIRSQCTEHRFRSVYRLENEAVLDRMEARLAKRPDILERRRETVEHPFGSIKQWMYQGAFLMRGLENVRGEFSLTALVYNLRRALNIVGVFRLELSPNFGDGLKDQAAAVWV